MGMSEEDIEKLNEKLETEKNNKLRKLEIESRIKKHEDAVKALEKEIESNTKSEQDLNAKIAEQTEKQRKIESGILKYEEQQKLEAKQSKLKERLASARTDEEIHKSIVKFGKM